MVFPKEALSALFSFLYTCLNFLSSYLTQTNPSFMIYYPLITRSNIIQSNLHLTLFNVDHCILSCTKSVRVIFERKKSNRLKPQDVKYNGQVILSSSSISKFLGITFDSALTFRGTNLILFFLYNLYSTFLHDSNMQFNCLCNYSNIFTSLIFYILPCKGRCTSTKSRHFSIVLLYCYGNCEPSLLYTDK